MISPNRQIILSLKYDFWWHHFNCFFLSFQKILKKLPLDPRNSSYGSGKNPEPLMEGGVVEHFSTALTWVPLIQCHKFYNFLKAYRKRPFKWCVAIQNFVGALICHFSALDLLFMVSPNRQIIFSLKYDFCLNSLFLSFQKILKILTLDPQNSNYGSGKNPGTIDGGGV